MKFHVLDENMRCFCEHDYFSLGDDASFCSGRGAPKNVLRKSAANVNAVKVWIPGVGVIAYRIQSEMFRTKDSFKPTISSSSLKDTIDSRHVDYVRFYDSFHGT